MEGAQRANIPYALKDAVSQELLRQERDGIIERVEGSTEWLSNMVVVQKKGGGIRITIDLRRVNKAIIPDKHPLLSINDIATQTHQAKVFSKLDLAKAFLQIPLEDSSRDLTAFITHLGVFRWDFVRHQVLSRKSWTKF